MRNVSIVKKLIIMRELLIIISAPTLFNMKKLDQSKKARIKQTTGSLCLISNNILYHNCRVQGFNIENKLFQISI